MIFHIVVFVLGMYATVYGVTQVMLGGRERIIAIVGIIGVVLMLISGIGFYSIVTGPPSVIVTVPAFFE